MSRRRRCRRDTMTAVVASHVRRGRSPIAERCFSWRPRCSSCWLPVRSRSAPGCSGGVRNRSRPPSPSSSLARRDLAGSVGFADGPEHVFYKVFERPVSETRAAPRPMPAGPALASSLRIWVADPDGSNARSCSRRAPTTGRSLTCLNAGDAMVFTAPVDVDGQPYRRTHLAELGPTGDVSRRALSATRSLTTAALACAPLTPGSRSRRTARASRSCVPTAKARRTIPR